MEEKKLEQVSGGRYLAENDLAARGKARHLKEWWPNALPTDLAKFAGKELPKEALDSVSGGMSDAYREYLDFLIREAQNQGYTLDRCLSEMQDCGFPQEDINYVASNW